MMTIHEARQRMLFQLYDIYDNREAANIADLVLEKITGWKKIDRVINKGLPLLELQAAAVEKFTAELLTHKPVQYVLNEAWFYGRLFYVDENVLIPRPETEQLCEWIISESAGANLSFLDIGTGSGCIPVTLKLAMTEAVAYAVDISDQALAVARKNAAAHGCDINFFKLDILNSEGFEDPIQYDIIVSNPPYIPERDKPSMNSNVLNFEPHLALFVPDNDALLFYKAIAGYGRRQLKNGGSIYVEIHEDLSSGVQNIFASSGYDTIETRKDFQGKDRMIKATISR